MSEAIRILSQIESAAPQAVKQLLPLIDDELETVARIKHGMKNNWLKMYDKFGQVLQVETVINNRLEFKVRRWHLDLVVCGALARHTQSGPESTCPEAGWSRFGPTGC